MAGFSTLKNLVELFATVATLYFPINFPIQCHLSTRKLKSSSDMEQRTQRSDICLQNWKGNQVPLTVAMSTIRQLKANGYDNINEAVEEDAGHEVTQLQRDSLAMFFGTGIWTLLLPNHCCQPKKKWNFWLTCGWPQSTRMALCPDNLSFSCIRGSTSVHEIL